MSTKKAVEDKDPNEVGAFDPALSKEANKKSAPEEKHEEVKKEAEKHVESNPMLTTLAGRNEVKSGRASSTTSHVASHDTKKDKVSKPVVDEPVVHENAEHEPVHDQAPELKAKAEVHKGSVQSKDAPVKGEVKGHTGHTKEVSKDPAPKTELKGEKHE